VAESLDGGTRRVALFVDGDNLAPSLAGPILEAARRQGSVDVRRVYAAEAGFRAWEGAAGYRLIQVGGAKNGTDLLLCIEAVELACRGGFESVVIASDDRDFTHLATWLRERGLSVLGVGTPRSAADWRAACSAFEMLEVLSIDSKPLRLTESAGSPFQDARTGKAVPNATISSRLKDEQAKFQRPQQASRSLSAIDSQLRKLIVHSPRGVALQAIGSAMGNAKHQPPSGRDWRAYLGLVDVWGFPGGSASDSRWPNGRPA
jgi:hypothetical protein